MRNAAARIPAHNVAYGAGNHFSAASAAFQERHLQSLRTRPTSVQHSKKPGDSSRESLITFRALHFTDRTMFEDALDSQIVSKHAISHENSFGKTLRLIFFFFAWRTTCPRPKFAFEIEAEFPVVCTTTSRHPSASNISSERSPSRARNQQS